MDQTVSTTVQPDALDLAAKLSLKRLRFATIVLAVLVALAFPSLRYYFGTQTINQTLEIEAKQLSDALSQKASSQPDIWQFQRNAIEDTLAAAILRKEVSAVQVIDLKNKELGRSGAWVEQARTAVTAPVMDSGLVVGYVIVQARTENLTNSLFGVACLGIVFGLLLHFVVQRFALTSITHTLDQLQDARHDAETASRARAAFLATMSHEIRTPMNGVIGMTSLLMSTPLTSEQRHFVETIRVSGDGLLTVINDILEFSKVESGRIELEPHVFSPEMLVDEVLSILASAAQEKGVELISRVQPSVPNTAHADSSRIRQVLMNLVGNAIKFTQQGEVVVTVDCPAPNRLRYAVLDTGIGMSEEEQGRIFSPFVQADASTTRRFGGTGLGLAISLRLAQLMKGTINVSSKPKQGSVFTAEVAIETAQQAEEIPGIQDNALPELTGRRILIVDDNQTNTQVLEAYCKTWGMQVTVAHAGAAALQSLKGANAFDLALLDYNMPDMNGIMLAQQIKQERPTLKCILASSGSPQLEEVKRWFDAHTTKPIRRSKLYTLLRTTLHTQVLSDQTQTPRVMAEVEQHLRVLVVEDNPINAVVIRAMLKRCNLLSDLAGNGIEAIQAAQRQPYDVIFMDMLMPDMDGLSATRHIRALDLNPRPYIVALTANVLSEDQEACMAAGMDEFLTKPVKLDQLRVFLSRFSKYQQAVA